MQSKKDARKVFRWQPDDTLICNFHLWCLSFQCLIQVEKKGKEMFATIREYWPGKDSDAFHELFRFCLNTNFVFASFFIYSLLLHPPVSSSVNTYLITNHNEARRADVLSRKALRKGYEQLLQLQAADKLSALWNNKCTLEAIHPVAAQTASVTHCVHAGVQLAGHRRPLSLLSPAFAFLSQRGTLWLIYF